MDQDKLGILATRWMKYGALEIWFKPLDGGAYAFCFINRGSEPLDFNQDMKTTIKKYVIDGNYSIRDLWKHEDAGSSKENVKGTLAPHDVLMIKLTRTSTR